MSVDGEGTAAAGSRAGPEEAVWFEIVNRWKSIVLSGVVSAVLAVSASFLSSPRYESTTTVTVVENAQSPLGLGAVMERVGGLASLVGIGSASSATDEVVARLRSREFSAGIIEALDLGPALFPSDWDAHAIRWKNVSARPSDAELFDKFDSRVRSVRVDAKTGLIQVSVRLPDRMLAARVANEIVAQCNTLARAQEVKEAEYRIGFLMREAESAKLVSLRDELYSAVQVEIHRVAMAKSRRDFALRVIDPAVPADQDRPSSPNRPLLGILGLLVGLFGAAAIAAVRLSFRRSVNP